MSDTQQPQTIVQAGGRIAEGLIGGFQGAPTLLLILILNIVMIVVSGYYLLKQDEQRNLLGMELVGLIRSCILETAPIRSLEEQLYNNDPRTGSLGSPSLGFDADRYKVEEQNHSAEQLEPIQP